MGAKITSTRFIQMAKIRSLLKYGTWIGTGMCAAAIKRVVLTVGYAHGGA